MGYSIASLSGRTLATVGLLMAFGCSSADPEGSAGEWLETADERWAPDLDADGDADAVILIGNEVRFAVSEDGDLVDITDGDGDVLVITTGEHTTVTCQDEGAFVQTFEPPNDDSPTGPLRLSRLDVDGSTGVLTPSPSFFFGTDFELPELGHGCPAVG